MSPGGWIVAYLCRWLPHRAPTGLFPIGSPDEHSPVITTGNFSLTVRRVKRALAGRSVWLLVANSDGINVWCAAAGGALTENRVIDAVKVSELAGKVAHRELILPALSAPGVAPKPIHDETGFHVRLGPVYARDIPAYLEGNKSKPDHTCRFRPNLRHRLDMFLSMNFPFYVLVALVVAVFCRQYLLGTTLLFWSAIAVLYLFIDAIPGRTGWAQAAVAGTACVLGWLLFDWMTLGDPLRHWGWLIATFAIFLVAGIDLAGIATGRRSDPERLLIRLGCKRLGHVFSEERELGRITLDPDECEGCGICREICPLAVFGQPDPDGKTTLLNPDTCFACGACVKQCPESALHLTAD
jgi:NAD-dependent dihydropyrimidine dehydrogenase PreA subunit